MKLYLGLAVLVAVYTVAFAGYVAGATSVRFEQQINPIECIFTTTQTGETVTTSDDCDEQPIPTITSILGGGGRPVILGKYSSARAGTLRVWLGGQWYTLGVDARLKANGDNWKLDLSGLKEPLPPGDYEVSVAIQTHDGYMIRNSAAGRFHADAPLQAPGDDGGLAPATESSHLGRSWLSTGFAVPYFGSSTPGQVHYNPESLTFLQLPVSLHVSNRADVHRGYTSVSMLILALAVVLSAATALALIKQYRSHLKKLKK